MMSIQFLMPIAFQAGGGLQSWGPLFLPVSILLIFYVLVWMPARKRQKDFQTLLGGLKKGDRVVTTGGLYGEVVSVEADGAAVMLRIADNVKVKVAKSAIATLQGEGDKGDNR
jgi:preprotein translocase subunit YajC